MEDRLNKLFEAQAAEMVQMELRLSKKQDDRVAARTAHRTELHEAEIETLREVEARDMKQASDLHQKELTVNEHRLHYCYLPLLLSCTAVSYTAAVSR